MTGSWTGREARGRERESIEEESMATKSTSRDYSLVHALSMGQQNFVLSNAAG